MKKINKKIIVTFCIACVMIGCMITGISLFNKYANAETEVVYIDEYDFKSEYTLNDTLTFPSLSNVKLRVDDKLTRVVSRELTMPDGTVSTLDEVVLSETGNYTLTYFNNAGNSIVIPFKVNQKSYSENNCSTEYTQLANSQDGISVTLKNNGSFSFNKTVNIYDYAGSRLDVCNILPLFRENKNSKPNATHVSIKLVDAFDSSKYIEFVLWCDSSIAPYYMSSGAASQNLTGLEQNVNRASEMIYPYEGDMYKIHFPTRYQVSAMYGRWLGSQQNSQMISHGGINVQLDVSNAKVYAIDDTEYLVTDLDSSEIYGENTIDLQSYFTNGDVYLSVECYNYSTSSMEIQLSSVLGYSGEQLKNEEMVDTIPPVITIENTSDSLILAAGKAISLPKIKSIIDVNYYGDNSVSVYRNYGKSSQYSVSIKNGQFIPSSKGVYTAVYTAKDSYGNIGTYELNMSVIDEKPFTYQEKICEKLLTCQENILPKIDVSSLNNGLYVTVKVIDPDGVETVLKESESGYKYIPTSIGTHTIEYIFTDDVYSETFSYTINAENEGGLYMKEELGLSKYYIQNATYELPVKYVYGVGQSGLESHELEYYVSEDGGEFTKISDTSKYTITAKTSIQFKLRYDSFEKTTPVYPVVDTGFGSKISERNYIKYVQGDYVSTNFTTDGISYTYTSSGIAEFISPISLSNFKYIGSFIGEASSVSLILTDVYNSQNRVEIVYSKNGGYVVGKIKEYVGGELTGQKAINISTSMTGSYEVEIDSNMVTLGTNEGIQISKFTSDIAYLTYQIEEPSDEFTLTIKQINNQQFTSSTRMKESGACVYYTSTDGSYDIGDQFVISPCEISGVLNPVSTKDVKLSVINIETEEYIKDISGLELKDVVADKNYTIALSMFGQLRVVYTYSVVCSNKNGQTTIEDDSNYVININDTVKPTITFENNLNSLSAVSISKGSTHTLVSYVITDNATSEENIVSYAAVCDDHFNILANGYKAKEYTFNKVGIYYVVVNAYDEYGNYARNYYQVIVK